jgi:hypothetical protein
MRREFMAAGSFRSMILVCGVAGLLAGEARAAQPVVPQDPRTALPPLPPPPAKPPAELFRQLLAATPAERETMLAGKLPQSLQVITNALREYESLSAGAREVRLHTLELGWHLDPLLRLAPSNRIDRLAAFSEPFRQELEDRLRVWDGLPQGLQRMILDNRRALRVMLATNAAVRAVGQDAGKRPPAFPPLPPTLEAQRQKVHASLRALFDLDDKEKARVIDSLSFTVVQRAHVEKALQPFESLPKLQRDLCVDGLTKFGNLSPAQRDEFARKCESWKSMSATEQEAWRRLVAIRLKAAPLPPLPPVGGGPPLPPLPSRPGSGASKYPPPRPGLATNGHEAGQ